MNEKEIRRTLELFATDALVEVRTINGGRTHSGYFRNPDKLIKAIQPYDYQNIYFVLNEIDEACYSREQKDRIMQSKTATTDKDIKKRNWILIDIDSKRTTGVSSTDEEKEHSILTGRKIYAFLRDLGFSTPISADSGNGVHLLYKVNMENTQENTDLVKTFLNVLDIYFSNAHAEVDTSVFNASRITKLYGTVARKGQSTEERPHRLSRILNVPGSVKSTPKELLKKVADLLPPPPKPVYQNNYGRDRFDLRGFISKHGIRVRKEEGFSGGRKLILEHCVFNHEHKNKDACIFEMSNGAIGYKCFHNQCQQYKWQDVRMHFEPDAYNKFTTTQPVSTPQVKDERKGGKFIQMHEVTNVDRSKLVYIKSHFGELDRKIIGFLKGEVSIWSGLNGSGKSSVLNQLSIQAINDGFKVAMYSGELTPNRVKSWVHLQGAGRQFTKPTEYANYYYVPLSIGQKIDRWLKGKFFLYNNDYGNRYSELTAELEKLLAHTKIDVLILDNIMSMDLDELDRDNNSRQKKAILSISSLAKKYNVHIHIVAHPRKSNGFLRKQDISGASELANVVDNIFIVHRVGNDFLREAKDFFGEKEASRYYNYDNVIEVCKNRDLGVLDTLFGLYFEVESKRLLNERFENPIFGWQDVEEQKSISYAEEINSLTPTPDQFGNTGVPF